MAFGVFIHDPNSIYDDSPSEHYQFPVQYLDRARACLEDWIIYYAPKKSVGKTGYFAVAKVAAVEPDPSAPDKYLALIEPGSYLEFANTIPFSGPEGPIEQGLLNEKRHISRAQWSIRPISRADFVKIVERGLTEEAIMLPRIDALSHLPGFHEEQAPFDYQQDRERVGYLSSRIVRDRVFRKVVLRAYNERCAVTGLRLINGGGRAEVEAAHIRPVEANGPDIVSNGLALSGTAHWMFDRGLISVEDDLSILVSRQINDADGVTAIINSSGSILAPMRASDRPHPNFLRWHRQNCFKA